MKSFIPPAWQIPGLLDGTIGQVSWPIPRKLTEWQWADGFEGVAWRIPNATVYSNGVWHTWDADGVGGENSREATVEKAKAEALQSAIDQGFIKCHVKPGDVLAGKERFGIWSDDIPSTLIVYEADRSAYHDPREMRRAYKTDHVEEWMRVDWNPWDYDCPMAILPANRCPLELCRLHLRVLSIRAQRCVDATEADAIAEGVGWMEDKTGRSWWHAGYPAPPTSGYSYVNRLRNLWQPAYARRGLEWENSWRWVAKVERVNQGKRGNS
jgi:hypothetical protein